jgi:hypothetical protein
VSLRPSIQQFEAYSRYLAVDDDTFHLCAETIAQPPLELAVAVLERRVDSTSPVLQPPRFSRVDAERALAVLLYIASSPLDAMVKAHESTIGPPLAMTHIGSTIIALGFDIPASRSGLETLSTAVSSLLGRTLKVTSLQCSNRSLL